MDAILEGRTLREERGALATRFYSAPRRPVHAPVGAAETGQCSIRMLLTWVSSWRGAGVILHPAGVWPSWREGPDGPLVELGPALGPRYPLLTDVQIVRLLCEGCPFPRPHPDALATYLSEIELDVHDPAAQMRAILCADIFHEWRAGSYVWRERVGLPLGAQPGLGCRLAHCRATMGRLIAGLNVHMFPQGRGLREAIVYADDAAPA